MPTFTSLLAAVLMHLEMLMAAEHFTCTARPECKDVCQVCEGQVQSGHGSLYAVMWLADEPREFNLPTLPQRRIAYVPEKLPGKYGVHSEEYLPIRTGVIDSTKKQFRPVNVLTAPQHCRYVAWRDGEERGDMEGDEEESDNAGEMSPGSSTESYPAFAHLGLRENPGKNLNQVTCPDRESNPGHLVSRPDALTVTPQVWTL
ncbi:hypothetical protein ANN_16418 [Periplaneta americana]|uniref:Uncharacterized protein n=1 Tax=Periplaneta americana TaxID=6978 RepID=A0ABQ8SIW8_PERAM|nr:hypothetical protein ANN_16418 [Periplaneta americana]